MAFRSSALPVVSAILVGLVALGGNANASPERFATKEVIVPQPASLDSTSPTLDSGKLNHSIREVLEEDVFQWRMPRDAKPKDKNAPKSWLESFVDDIHQWWKSAIKGVGDGFERWMKEKFKDLLGDRTPMNHEQTGASTPWADVVSYILYGLLAVLVVILALILVRQWRRLPPAPQRAVADAAPVNLESDQVVATQLPENEWLRLAEEKIEAGEFRLAMRAFFLATLAHLGERKLLAIRRTKSNGDYVRELVMRARDRDELRGRFDDSVRTFDWAWYGWHEVTAELLAQFRENHQQIINDGSQAH